MLKTLRIRNFKAWQDTGAIELAPITLFFGSNSSGKTSLLQSLLLLKQTAEVADRSRVLHLGDKASLVELGAPKDVAFKHRLDVPMGFELGWTPRAADFPGGTFPDGAAPGSELRFELELGFAERTQAPFVAEMKYTLDGRSVGMKRRGANPEAGKYDVVTKGMALKRKPGRKWALPDPTRFYGFPDPLVAYYENAQAVSDYPLALEELLARFHYVGPLRDAPGREYVWTGHRPRDVGKAGESVIPVLLAASQAKRQIPERRPRRGQRPQSLDEVIAGWLRSLGIIHAFAVRPLVKGGRQYEVRVRRTAGSPEVLLPDVGFGVSQVLPVLVQAFAAEPDSTMLFEQPELHLHPSAQSNLGDALIDASLRCGVQLIIESHSEHLLRRLQLRVAQQQIPKEHVALYTCEVVAGASTLERLHVDDDGNITNWPRDFFGDDLGDLVGMAEAAATRRAR